MRSITRCMWRQAYPQSDRAGSREARGARHEAPGAREERWGGLGSGPWSLEPGASSERSDEFVHPVVDRAEGVLAQHRALCLVVELEVHPVDREVAVALLGRLDEFTAEAGPGGLRGVGERPVDALAGDDPIHHAPPFEQVVQAP